MIIIEFSLHSFQTLTGYEPGLTLQHTIPIHCHTSCYPHLRLSTSDLLLILVPNHQSIPSLNHDEHCRVLRIQDLRGDRKTQPAKLPSLGNPHAPPNHRNTVPLYRPRRRTRDTRRTCIPEPARTRDTRSTRDTKARWRRRRRWMAQMTQTAVDYEKDLTMRKI